MSVRCIHILERKLNPKMNNTITSFHDQNKGPEREFDGGTSQAFLDFLRDVIRTWNSSVDFRLWGEIRWQCHDEKNVVMRVDLKAQGLNAGACRFQIHIGRFDAYMPCLIKRFPPVFHIYFFGPSSPVLSGARSGSGQRARFCVVHWSLKLHWTIRRARVPRSTRGPSLTRKIPLTSFIGQCFF